MVSSFKASIFKLNIYWRKLLLKLDHQNPSKLIRVVESFIFLSNNREYVSETNRPGPNSIN